MQKAQPGETLPRHSAVQLGKNYYSWICANLPVYKGNWDPSGQALQEEAVSASSALCDAEIAGWRVSAAGRRGARVLTTPRVAAPPFPRDGVGGRRGDAAVKLQF